MSLKILDFILKPKQNFPLKLTLQTIHHFLCNNSWKHNLCNFPGSLVSIIGLWNPRERIFSVSLRSYRLSSRMIFARWCVLHKNSLTEVDISEEEYLNSQYHPYPHLLIKDPTFIKGHIYCLQVGDGKGDIESSNKVDLKSK